MAGTIIALAKKEVDIFRVFVRNRTLLCYDFFLAFAVEYDVTNLVLLILHFTIVYVIVFAHLLKEYYNKK